MNIVPTNVVQAFANGDMLAIIFFSVMFGLGVAAIGEKGKPIIQFFRGTADAMFYVTNQIMKIAPLGVFGLIGVTVSKFGLASLIPLGKLVIVVYGAMIFFILVVLGIVAKIAGYNIFKLLSYLKGRINFRLFNSQFGNSTSKNYGENGKNRLSKGDYFLCYSNWLFL